MKPQVRYLSVMLASGALLMFAGCSTHPAATTSRATTMAVQPTYKFSVVQTSSELQLTDAQKRELRESVANYLRDQGLDREGEYYVKVNFTPELSEEEGQWAVVQIITSPARTYTVLAAYPGPDDYYPYEYYGYTNHGYPGFSRFGYYDPFDYNYGSSHTRPRIHVPPSPNDYIPPIQNYPPPVRPTPPRIAPTNWDNRTHPHPTRPRIDTTPRVNDQSRDRGLWKDRERSAPDRSRGYDRSSPRDHSPGGSSFTPPERVAPPSPPARAEPAAQAPQSRDDNTRSQSRFQER